MCHELQPQPEASTQQQQHLGIQHKGVLFWLQVLLLAKSCCCVVLSTYVLHPVLVAGNATWQARPTTST
jgi:hypothetical protein